MKRRVRQNRYNSKPETRELRRKTNQEYYWANRDRLKTAATSRALIPPEPEKLARLRTVLRTIAPGEPIPADASLATKNGFGTKTNRSLEWILEGRRDPNGEWEFASAAPDLSTFLGLGGKGKARDLKTFVRDELLRRYPDQYPIARNSHLSRGEAYARALKLLPTEEEAARRPPVDFREREIRIQAAQRKAATRDYSCPDCRYFGPLIPNERGPLRAGELSKETMEKLGASPDDLLPGAFCPACRVLISFSPGSDLTPLRGEGGAEEFRCECGATVKPAYDPSNGEYNCPECGRVVGITLDDGPSRVPSRE